VSGVAHTRVVSATTFLLIVVPAWVVIGLLTSYVMGRRGHDLFSWGALGALFGPLVIPLAVDAARAERRGRVVPVVVGRRGAGPLHVLVGVDGSTEAAEAAVEVVTLLGDRLGDVTLATVLDFDAERTGQGSVYEREARTALGEVAASLPGVTATEVLLSGPPAATLAGYGEQHDVDLVVVGHRGRGLSDALLGSVAARLARECALPVLVGGAPVTATARGATDGGA